MKLIWTPKARADLRSIVDFISDFNPAASSRLLDLIEGYAERLPDHPFVGRPGRIPGTREGVVHPNYIVVYRVDDEAVRVIDVVHTRRLYPPREPG